MFLLSSRCLTKYAKKPIFNNLLTNYATCSSNRIAVILSGCGVYDGSEIHEAVSVLSHLTRNDAIPMVFAPSMKQHHVINHLTGEVDDTHIRLVHAEAARISRGSVHNICDLIKDIKCFDGVIFPGGFGAAKNLSDFAFKGSECSVQPEVAKVIECFHKAKKPQGFICISPVLAAKILCGITITLGKNSCDKWPHRAAIQEAEKMGAIVELRDWNEISYDAENLIFSTPAYMYDGCYHEIDDAIGCMVKYMLLLIRKGVIDTKEKCPPENCRN